MKLLLDQGLPRSTPTWLKQAGIDAIHVAEIGLQQAGKFLNLMALRLSPVVCQFSPAKASSPVSLIQSNLTGLEDLSGFNHRLERPG